MESASDISSFEILPKLRPVFNGDALFRVAWGGRGSGKTRAFAFMTVLRGIDYSRRGVRGIILCAREYQKSINDSSLEEIKRVIQETPAFRNAYDVGEQVIRTKDGRISFSFMGLQNITQIKSMGRLLICWVDEAQSVKKKTWDILIPTMREEGFDMKGKPYHAELWVTWNPVNKDNAVEEIFRLNPCDRTRGTELNWSDNKFFPKTLNDIRLRDKERSPDMYEHIWEGAYLTSISGAYYAKELLKAKEEGRICNVYSEPLIPLRAFWDIGGTGKKSDATAIWIAQFVNREIRVIDYYERNGVPLHEHVAWLKKSKYGDALMVLPHDGATKDRIHNVSFQSELEKSGFRVIVIKNRVGAARLRIEAVRRVFHKILFNEQTTIKGRLALGWYHEDWDEENNCGKGPKHDWSSHAADAFGLMCVSYEEPNMVKRRKYSESSSNTTSWMCI